MASRDAEEGQYGEPDSNRGRRHGASDEDAPRMVQLAPGRVAERPDDLGDRPGGRQA